MFLASRDLKTKKYHGPGLRSYRDYYRNSYFPIGKFAKTGLTRCPRPERNPNSKFQGSRSSSIGERPGVVDRTLDSGPRGPGFKSPPITNGFRYVIMP